MENSIISPLTGSSNVANIGSFPVSDILQKWKEQLKIDITSEFNSTGISTFNLYRCNDSQLLFFKPSLEGSPYIYQELQDNFNWYYVEEKWEYDVAIGEIRGAKNCLEVGSGSGAFIKKALAAGINVIGTETSADAVQKAHAANLPVHLLSFDQAIEKLGAKPDVVLAFQVLEHIADPLPFIQGMVDMLEVGGKLIICVPNADSFYKYDNNVLDMPPHHQTRWSLATFKAFEQLFPLKLQTVDYEPLSHWHVPSWVNAVGSHFRANKWYGKLIFNRQSTRVINRLLRTRIRSLIRGHSIYVSFEKTQ